MSSEQDQVRALAERVARRLASTNGNKEARGDGASDDLAALREGLDKIQRRLAHIESHIKHDDSCERAPRAAHSSFDTPPAQDASSGQSVDADVQKITPTRSLWLSGTYVPATEHPSDERFGIGEAVSEMVDFFEREKSCQMEPGGKPCDHCSMCSTRGF